MNNTDELIARLKAFRGMWMGDGLHPSIERQALIDALTAPAATIAEQAAQIEALRLERDNAEGMAGCMAMFRKDMIEAGVITDAVAPMFMTEAILSKLSALRADAERWRHAIAPGVDQSMRWLEVYEHWNGEGDFTAAIDAAMKAGKAVTP